MSAKVCVAPVKPEWKDAVTLGELQNMIAALYELGYHTQTPVTYLHDHAHVWLETVDDDDVVIVLERQPRVVEQLTDDCRDAEWIRDSEERYRWDDKRWEFTNPYAPNAWVDSCVDVPGIGGSSHFTEVLS